MTINTEALGVAERFSEAIAAQDIAAISNLYADDIVIWHNTTNAAQSKAENLGLLSTIFSHVSDLHYENITRLPTPEGCVQYHTVASTLKDGVKVRDAHSCMVFKVKNGKIVWIGEWLDSAQLQQIWDRMSEGAL